MEHNIEYWNTFLGQAVWFCHNCNCFIGEKEMRVIIRDSYDKEMLRALLAARRGRVTASQLSDRTIRPDSLARALMVRGWLKCDQSDGRRKLLATYSLTESGERMAALVASVMEEAHAS